MAETPNRNLPLVDPDQPQRDGAARINTALTAVDGDIAALLLALGQKANAADIGPAITAAIAAVVNGSPEAFDTLFEIAAKLAENDDAVAAIMASLATKANAANVYSRATVDNMMAAEAQARTDADAAEATARADAYAALNTAIDSRAAKLAWEAKSASFAADAGKAYVITGAITATLPAAPTEDDTIGFLGEGAETTPYTVNFNGKTFEGSTASAAVGKPFLVLFVYRLGAWRLS